MRLSPSPQRRCEFFISAKTRCAIPLVGCDFFEDVLVQASLDPFVRAIDFVPPAHLQAAPVGAGDIVVDRDDGRFRLDFVPARRIHSVGAGPSVTDGKELPSITLTADEIRRQPRFANARAVWAFRHHQVGLPLRMQILQTVDEEGPIRFGHLLAAVRSDHDPAPAVLSLVCSDLLEMDLVSRPLGPATMLRGRSRR